MGVITINFSKFLPNNIELNQDPTSAKACNNFQVNNHLNTGTYYLPLGETWVNATLLYTDSALITLAPAFWYSDGNIAREWDGNNFIGTNLAC